MSVVARDVSAAVAVLVPFVAAAILALPGSHAIWIAPPILAVMPWPSMHLLVSSSEPPIQSPPSMPPLTLPSLNRG